ncbi:MAG: prohibitin family protein [Proteobacteria bacterium]|nr:prohibitin family protein [Pseudomonadota bacterium]
MRWQEEEQELAKLKKKITNIIKVSLIFIVAVGAFFGTMYSISAGERGVLLTFGKPDVTPKTEGLHFKIPLAQKIVKMEVKTQKYETDASSSSKDLQIVSTKLAVNYHLNPSSVVTIYQEIGLDYNNRLIQPAVQEVVKASTAQFTAEELITKRSEVKEKIKELLKLRLDQRGILVEEISITNFDFSDEFNKAIEMKVTAEQQALTAKNKLEQVKYEAEQRIAQAEAEAEAIKIQAEAITSQGGKDYVQLKMIEKWDGKLPVYSLGNAMPFIQLPVEVPK